jgi:hypothetical protein
VCAVQFGHFGIIDHFQNYGKIAIYRFHDACDSNL